MTATRRYCWHCDCRREVQVGERACPVCGRLLAAGAHEPTVQLHTASTGDWQANVAPPPSQANEDRLVGRQFDYYRVERFLGRGGMARVYLARHLELDRPCAIKLLRSDGSTADLDRLNAFVEEARAAAALVHPHVVTLYTLGRLDDQRFIEMEYVDGVSLAQWIDGAAPADPLQATRIMLQLGSALVAAHELGMIHRDIKPGNVMLTKNHEAKLADFGLAKRLQQGRLTHELCGTPHYMAPELFRGVAAGVRSDLYAMGVTFFYMLVGRLPVSVDSLQELIRAHTEGTEPDWRTLCEHLPPRLCEILARCLDRDPLQRYATAAELHDALRAAFGSLRSLADLLKEALQDTGARWQGKADHYRVRVRLPDGRTQQVHVALTHDTRLNEQLVRIFSVCGPVSDDYYEAALHLNARNPFGAIGIEQVEGRACFVMANSFPRATCDAAELRHSVLTIAAHADQIERLLTGDDQH